MGTAKALPGAADSTSNALNKGSAPDNGARSEFDVLATDTYLIKVLSSGGGTGTYTVKAWDITSEQAYGEFTSGFKGGRVKIDDGNAMTGNISSGGDFDWYLALLEEDKCYAFHAKGEHTNANHNGGTLNDPEITLMKFFDYYEKQYFDPVTHLYKEPAVLDEDYYETVYIDPANFKNISSADEHCVVLRPDDTDTDRKFCSYYSDDEGGQGNNAKIQVSVGTGGGGDYLIGVKSANGRAGTYSVFVEEITCPSE